MSFEWPVDSEMPNAGITEGVKVLVHRATSSVEQVMLEDVHVDFPTIGHLVVFVDACMEDGLPLETPVKVIHKDDDSGQLLARTTTMLVGGE